MKRLYSKIISINELTDNLSNHLFNIYFKYFENVVFDIFKEHISAKDKIIILYDHKTNIIQGFSTFKVVKTNHNGKDVTAVFSGDTIIEKEYWGEQELVRAFCYLSGTVAKTLPKDEPLYWLLISKGYKTYRYLPVFTKRFIPSFDTPPQQEEIDLRNTFYSSLYPNEYDQKTGLITFKNDIGNLRSHIGSVETANMSNPHISFFAKENPEHMKGVELACLTVLSEDNMKSIALEFFCKGLASPHEDRYL